MTLWAISDLHLASEVNRDALSSLPDHGADWLIIAGDIGEKFDHLKFALSILTRRFAKVIWVPGNHDLWAIPEAQSDTALAGQERYAALVALAQSYGVLTPEDDFATFESDDGPLTIAPLFLLYDYSFRPASVARLHVVEWAREANSVCADETFLSPAPWPSCDAWCAERLRLSIARLSALAADTSTVLVNHWPLRADLIQIPRIPRFKPWCGTTATDDWHQRFNARVVVSGHLHTRRTDWRDTTRFEEVSLGYPRQWDQRRCLQSYLRKIASPSDSR